MRRIISCILLAGIVSAEQPAIVWTSSPVKPGEAVVVYGGPFENTAEVKLTGSDTAVVKPLKVTSDSVTFVYPADWKQCAFGVEIGGAKTTVNTPVIWWVQGNLGNAASPYGWLRVFGRSIGFNDKTRLTLSGNGRTVELKPEAYDEYNAKFIVPEQISPGDYSAVFNNGLLKQGASIGMVKIVTGGEFWKSKIFNIADYGAIPNDATDDSRAILAALEDIKKNDGGILLIPRGRFEMQGTLELPPNTLLSGVGMQLSQLYWLDEDNPSKPLITGRYNFGITQLFLTACNIDEGVVTVAPEKTDTWTNRNIFISKVRVRFVHTDTSGAEESFRRSKGQATGFGLHGDSMRITDCDFYTSKGSSHFSGDWIEFCNNRLSGHGDSCTYIHGEQVIFENNDHRGRGISFGNGTRNFYMAKNHIGELYNDGDRETMTFDGGNPCRSEKAESIGPASITFKKAAWRHGEEFWPGKPIFIIGGKGVGQQRFIKEIKNGCEVMIDRPWIIQPDLTSHFVIAITRSQLIFSENDVVDGNPFAMYGTAIDAVVVRNKSARNGGFHAHGMDKGSPEPSWFVQFIENEVTEGNAFRGPFSYIMPAQDGWIGFFDRGIRRPLDYYQNRIGIMRRNVLKGNAYLTAHGRVDGILMENNLIQNSDKGIFIGQAVRNALLRGNRFEKVSRPFILEGDAQVSPEDVFAAQVATADVGPQKDALSLLRAVSTKYGDKPISSALFATLTGLDPEQSSQWVYAKLGTVPSCKGYLDGTYLSGNPPAVISASAIGFPGWTVKGEGSGELLPGKASKFGITIGTTGKVPVAFDFPVTITVSGDGWKLSSHSRFGNKQADVGEFLCAGPFKNTSGKDLDETVHPPEINLDLAANYETLDGVQPWRTITKNEKGGVDLCSVLKNTEMATAHVVAVLRAKKPMQVKIDYGSNQKQLMFVNGVRIGATARRDAVRCVNLNAGDNLLHLITSHGSGAWPVRIIVTAVDPVLPGELEFVSATEIAKSALFVGGKTGAKTLEHTGGISWKELYRDDFNRARLGQFWEFKGVPWMSQSLKIEEGALTPESGWGFIGYPKPVKGNVRIEFDLIGKKGSSMAGVFLCPKDLLWRNFWGNIDGRGYLFSLGWHDAKNNRLMRNAETVVLKEKNAAFRPEPNRMYHVIAQFIPPKMEFRVDGEVVLSYDDPAYMNELDQIGLFTIGGWRFDNVRVFEGGR